MSTEQKHAYLIMTHGHWEQLNKLLGLLDDERNDIFLHVDKRAKGFCPETCRRAVCRAGLYITPRIKVYWGHSSQVDCELLLLRECLKRGSYAWVHLISGVDLPIKSQDQIHKFFAEHPDTQFLQIGDAGLHLGRLSKYHLTSRWKHSPLKSRVDSVLNGLHRKLHIDRLKKYHGIRFVKTANWFSLTGECAAYVLSQKKFIRRLTRYTRCADEMFLGTVIYNSPFWEQVYQKEQSWDGHMRYIDRIRSVGSSPHTFTMDDKDLLESSEMLFARKFDDTVDAEIIDWIGKNMNR